MDRQEFLEHVWKVYPSAKQSGWMDVSAYCAASSVERAGAIVCGRWWPSDDASREGRLEFGGRSLDLALAEHVKWLERQRSDVAIDPRWFVAGDLIAVQLGFDVDSSQKVIARVESLLLLAPRRESFPEWRGFDFETSRNWQIFVAKVRSFFSSQDFIEARTPTLVASPGTEPFLEAFSTEWRQGSRRKAFFLPTSPEFHLKKLMARGWPRLFEIKTCFRNEEVGAHHQAEFAMLEWYRAFSNLETIADDVEALLICLGAEFGKSPEPLLRTTVRDLFRDAFDGFELTPQTSKSELLELAKRVGVETREDDKWDELYFRLFLERIEPKLGLRQPTLVHGYPASQAALSRIGENGFADRFEIYWRGLEIANAFHELNDPVENEARFEEDARVRRDMGKAAVPRDEDLVVTMRCGFPPSGGIALGLERLFMAMFEIPTIEKTRAFPLVDQNED